MWQPKYSLSNSIVNNLTKIEAVKVLIENTPLPALAIAEISKQARIKSTHYSTRIEGNRLTLEEAEEAILGRKKVFLGRERDVAEVHNYWEALNFIEKWADEGKPFSENFLMRIHSAAMNGKRTKLSAYRNGQNAIRDSLTGMIVYLPPEAKDVPMLMREMVDWICNAFMKEIPSVIIAGLAHYQYVTIHPYYDGNGRSARLLATYLLRKSGYGLKGIYSLEEYHSRDLSAYYDALDVGNHHNYYAGRVDADLTEWLEYFTTALTIEIENVKNKVLKYADVGIYSEPEQIRALDQRARMILILFIHKEYITSTDVANELSLSERMARELLANWVRDGWINIAEPSRRARKYSLSSLLRDYLNNNTKYRDITI